MSTPFRLLLPRQFYTEMLGQAEAERPNECCGLLAGRIESSEGIGRVEKRYPLVNAAASPIEYLSDARSMFDAYKDMRKHGIDVIGIYHSHPTSAPVPSRKDREDSFGPDVVNLIISLAGPEPIVRAWWLTADGHTEAGWELVDQDGS